MGKKSKKTRGRPSIGKPRSIRVSDEDWKAWHKEAKQQGVELSTWIREAARLHRERNHAATV